MAYSKPYRSVDAQLALIKSRGMGVSDDALAAQYLNKIGYYRLSGYWYPYRRSTAPAEAPVILDEFRDGTRFSEIVALYVFDKKLRLLMMDVIERIEIALRVQITLELGKTGPGAHRDRAALHPNFVTRTAPGSTETKHQRWLRKHDDAYLHSKEEFAKHFRTKYAGEDPPIWIAAELWDFGAMSHLYSGMRKPSQDAVARCFGVSDFRIMESWLHALNVARNVCAHHSRFWNKPSAVQPRWPTAAACPDLGHIAGDVHAQTRAYGIACICAYLLKSINPNSTWIGRFRSEVGTFPESKIVRIGAAGFPDEWDKANLWA